MNDKTKEILFGTLIATLILFFGLSPIEQNVAFALDWGGMGARMIEAGVVDKDKMESLHMSRGGMSDWDKNIMYGENGDLEITEENSHMALHMLWAFGLSNKNEVLENGPLMDPKYGGAERFASTGGWTLGVGSSMDHYSMHQFVKLTRKEQARVEEVAKHVFRPCCKNSTYFPDCNHGMAMLGLLELMASQGATEQDMYKVAQEVNALWFPEVKSSCSA